MHWYDYKRMANTLVMEYPHETVQAALRMFLESYTHRAAGLELLVGLGQLDPLIKQEVFGYHASYIKLACRCDPDEKIRRTI